jgi:hypothetical protein
MRPRRGVTWFRGCRVLVHEDSNARWSGRGTVEIVGAMHVCPCGEFGVEAGATHQVQSEESLWRQAIPKVQREVVVCAAQNRDEVILKSMDGMFSGIASIDARGH